jgi:tetratricopeptide (TPR) repeat protein
MSGDAASLAADMTPYLSAAVGAYGGAVLAKVRDEAADATVGLGRRLLLRVFGPRAAEEPLPGPLADLAADPDDEDALAAVRLAVRQVLAADPVLAGEVRSMLAGAPVVTQRVRARRDAYTAGGNQTIINQYSADVGHPPGLAQQPPGAADGPVVVGDIPQQPPGFQPRPDLLADLEGAGPGPLVVRAVTGMRGVGKTQLAAAYARAKLAEGWRLVAWVNASDPGRLLAGLAGVADAVGLAVGGEAGGDPGRVVRHWLETGGDRCLIVFDDATDADVLRPFVPAAGKARVLITSNRQSVANLGTSVGVEVFTEEEALAFLVDRTSLADTAGAATVADELGYLPLALAQAAAVIAGQHLRYGTYLKRLRALPVAEYLTRGAGQPYPHGVAEAVLLSLDAVRAGDQGEVCIGVMEMMALLSAAGVRRELMYEAGQAGLLSGGGGHRAAVAASVVDAALARLAEASLLTFTLDGQAVIAHRLVIRVVRDGLAWQGRLAAVCRDAAAVLGARAQALAGSLDRVAVRDLPEQVTALLDHAASFAFGAGEELTGMLLGLRGWALYHLNELGDSAAQAILTGDPLVADCERVLGPDHPSTLTTRNNLAYAYRAAGRAAEAIPLHEQTLAAREQALGPDHPSTLTSRNNLAEDYREAGRAAEAIPLHEQTLADRERVLGPDHPHTLASRNNLAAAYQEAGRAAEAIPLHEQTLAALERVLGPDHPHTLGSRNNLAVAYEAAGRAAEAISLFEQILAAQERGLGPDHPTP